MLRSICSRRCPFRIPLRAAKSDGWGQDTGEQLGHDRFFKFHNFLVSGCILLLVSSWCRRPELQAGHFDLAAQIIHWAGPFDPNDLHKVPRKSSKKSPAKMHLKAAELRAPAVLEAYLHCAAQLLL